MRPGCRRLPIQVPGEGPEVFQFDEFDAAVGHPNVDGPGHSLAGIEILRGFGRIDAAVARNGATRHPFITEIAIIEVSARRAVVMAAAVWVAWKAWADTKPHLVGRNFTRGWKRFQPRFFVYRNRARTSCLIQEETPAWSSDFGQNCIFSCL